MTWGKLPVGERFRHKRRDTGLIVWAGQLWQAPRVILIIFQKVKILGEAVPLLLCSETSKDLVMFAVNCGRACTFWAKLACK